MLLSSAAAAQSVPAPISGGAISSNFESPLQGSGGAVSGGAAMNAGAPAPATGLLAPGGAAGAAASGFATGTVIIGVGIGAAVIAGAMALARGGHSAPSTTPK